MTIVSINYQDTGKAIRLYARSTERRVEVLYDTSKPESRADAIFEAFAQWYGVQGEQAQNTLHRCPTKSEWQTMLRGLGHARGCNTCSAGIEGLLITDKSDTLKDTVLSVLKK